MSKSTQDLCIWLNQLAQQLEEDNMSIQLFVDKSFRIYINRSDEPVYDSDDQPNPIDINDLAYEDVQDFSDFLKQIVEDARDHPEPATPLPIEDTTTVGEAIEAPKGYEDNLDSPINNDA